MSAGAQVIAVASGKGGVGKTNVVVNLAVALARLRQRVAIVDADFSLGNVDVCLGLTPSAHIGHVLAGERALDEVVVAGPAGVRVVPAGSGLRTLTMLSTAQRDRLGELVRRLRADVDFVLIDTSSGISDNVVDTVTLAERVVLVTSVEPSAIVDAYATAKVVSLAAPSREIGVVVNSVRESDQALLTFRQLDVAATRFLGRSLRYYGFISYDAAVQEAVAAQRAVVERLPQAAASRCFRILATRMAGLGPRPLEDRGPVAAKGAIDAGVSQCA